MEGMVIAIHTLRYLDGVLARLSDNKCMCVE